MQSWWMSFVESAVKIGVTGTAAALTNYYLVIAIWPPPFSWWDSLEMAAWFGGQSFILSLAIRRIFNAL